MFDDKKEPEDIFSGTDPLAGNQPSAQQPQSVPVQPQQPGPVASQMQPQPNQGMARPTLESAMAASSTRSSSNRKLVIVAIIVVAIVLILLAVLVGLWIVRRGQPATITDQTTTPLIPPTGLETTPSTTEEPDESTIDETTTPEQPTIPAEVEQPEQPTDTDNDGLTDEEEVALGTSPTSPDTDNDGLNDSEEVRVWNTDPTNPDTDGDTFLDGAEVDNGYDPNQAGGVLLEVNTTTEVE